MNYEINDEFLNIVNKVDNKIKPKLDEIDTLCEKNSLKVLNAFRINHVSESDFNSTTGYGYNDTGRDAVERVYSSVFGAEDSLVRNQFISGTHALTVALFGILRPNDIMLSVSGKPYDTLDEVIGIKENASSLKSFGRKYDQIELINDDFDYEKIREYISKTQVKIVYIQRSKGYSTRKSISVEKLEKLVGSKFTRITHHDVIDILKKADVKWEFTPDYSSDIAKEHERYITEYFNGPVFITDWPKDIKAWYMKVNPDNKTVAAVDLEVPGAGELMGGSQREEDYDKLIKRCREMNVDYDTVDWFCNLRKFGGCYHSGFGMGFERLLIYLTGVENIRYVIPFPRTPGSCDF